MAPFHTGSFLQSVAPSISSRSNVVNSEVASQWADPSDILSLLLLVGGDVIQRAIAQLSGDPRMPTPVVFSFGWVAYTFTALLSAVGDNRLMPSAPDLQSVVINAKNGFVRTNKSWILGRVLRDYEKYWIPAEARRKLDLMLKKANRPKAGLCVSIFEADPKKTAGRPSRDLLWVVGYLVAIVQLVVAAIPWIIWNEWETFAVTAAGTTLAFVSASLPQWSVERWACRRHSTKTICLTEGNGAQHVLVIIGGSHGLDLEDLAGNTGDGNLPRMTRPILVILTLFWVGLLITVSGIHVHTWFLVAVGGLGMIYTILVAGAPRRPEAFGVFLKFKAVYVELRAMEALKAVENVYPGVGRSMLPTFFPGELDKEEVAYWANMKGIQKKGAALKAHSRATIPLHTTERNPDPTNTGALSKPYMVSIPN
ncbi:hypothetical protein MMC14_001255 [Varicellaria rhodocarpa]|nr:hypothetical protein [Varicellaria rhodocarpa]